MSNVKVSKEVKAKVKTKVYKALAASGLVFSKKKKNVDVSKIYFPEGVYKELVSDPYGLRIE